MPFIGILAISTEPYFIPCKCWNPAAYLATVRKGDPAAEYKVLAWYPKGPRVYRLMEFLKSAGSVTLKLWCKEDIITVKGWMDRASGTREPSLVDLHRFETWKKAINSAGSEARHLPPEHEAEVEAQLIESRRRKCLPKP